MRRTIVASLLVTLLVSVASSLVTTSAASAADTPVHATFGIEPASAASNGSSPYFSFGVTAGAAVADSVVILNYSSLPVSLQVYAADAVQAASGGFGLLLPTQKSVGVGAWVDFHQSKVNVTLPAATTSGPSKSTVPFIVHVPLNAAPGDHAGAILASLQTIGRSKSGKKIILNQRVGARVFVTVSGATRPGLRILNASTSVQGGLSPWQHDAVHVTYQVQNTGNVDVSLDQHVSARGVVADHGEVTLKNNPIIIPGGTVNESVTIPGLWPEVLTHVAVSATGSFVSVQGVHETVSASASTWVLTFPWVGLFILVVLVALLWWRRRRRLGHNETAAIVVERDA